MTSAGHPVPPWPARRPPARVPLSLGAPGRVTDAPESRHGAVDAVGPLPSSDEENPRLPRPGTALRWRVR